MKTPVAYSYIRFSHPDQAKGDSLRRQMELLDDAGSSLNSYSDSASICTPATNSTRPTRTVPGSWATSPRLYTSAVTQAASE